MTTAPISHPILFLSNTPTPYQLDFWNEVSTHTPVHAYFAQRADAKQNVAWQLAQPSWLHLLPTGSSLTKARHMIAALKGQRPRGIVLGGYRNAGALWLLAWARLRGIPVWFWLENPQPTTSTLKRWLKGLVNQLILRTANGILAICPRAQTAYSMAHPNVHFLPYSINGTTYANPRGPVTAPLKFLFVGQLIERKGVQPLLDAFKDIPPTVAHLTIAGTGPLQPQVQAFCQASGHTYAGFTQPSDLPKLLASQHVFVLPSLYDGWAVVVAEAMAAGLPVISTAQVGAFLGLVTPGQNGLLCTPDSASILQAVTTYIHQPVLAQHHGAAARAAFTSSRANAPHAAQFLLTQVFPQA